VVTDTWPIRVVSGDLAENYKRKITLISKAEVQEDEVLPKAKDFVIVGEGGRV
jgi:hypothetical protein